MRRRQAFAAQTAAREAALRSAHLGPSEPVNMLTVGTPAKPEKVYWEAIGEPTVWPSAADVIVTVYPKGTCRTCGKHIGKGIAMHRKACKA